jgi:hypothetical protein
MKNNFNGNETEQGENQNEHRGYTLSFSEASFSEGDFHSTHNYNGGRDPLLRNL